MNQQNNNNNNVQEQPTPPPYTGWITSPSLLKRTIAIGLHSILFTLLTYGTLLILAFLTGLILG